MNLNLPLRLGAFALFVAAFAPTPAFAYKHWEPPIAWGQENLHPLEYCVADYVEASLPGTDEERYAYQVFSIDKGFEAWRVGAPCADMEHTNIGTCAENSAYRYDLENRFSFDDPGDEVAVGVIGQTLCLPQSGGKFLFQLDGVVYKQMQDCDIIFNDNVDFTTDEAIENSTCVGAQSLRSVATHEIGHLLGMGHSCDRGDACTDFTLRDATMYWTGPNCDASGSDINDDDRQGMEALYGRSAQVTCNRELDPEDPETLAFGVVPFDLECIATSVDSSEIQSVDWSWGDGGTSAGRIGKHTYTEAGNYSVVAETNGVNESCGEWKFTTRKVGYVRACGIPDVAFELEPIEGLTYQFRNRTDLSVYGCIYDVQWDVFDDGGTLIQSVSSWEPKFEFPALGEYRVVLNVGGPAGTAAAEIVTEIGRASQGGCDTSGFAPIGLLGLAGVLAVARRRRS